MLWMIIYYNLLFFTIIVRANVFSDNEEILAFFRDFLGKKSKSIQYHSASMELPQNIPKIQARSWFTHKTVSQNRKIETFNRIFIFSTVLEVYVRSVLFWYVIHRTSYFPVKTTSFAVSDFSASILIKSSIEL